MIITEKQLYHALFDKRPKDIKSMIAVTENILPCYLALAYAICGEKEKASKIVNRITPTDCAQPTHRLALAEAQMTICYLQRDFSRAIEQAKSIILTFPDAIFANYILGRIALMRRDAATALVYYERLLKIHPRNDKVLLDMAKAFFLLRRDKEALDLIKQASSGLRPKLLHGAFLCSRPKCILLLWLGTSLLSVLTGFSIKVYLSVVICLLIGAIFLIKVDSWLFGLLLLVNIIITIAWFTTFFVWK